MGFALSDISLSSADFDNGGAIPRQHTGEGEDISPQLSWENIPDGCRSLAVICHDPDAPLVSKTGEYGFVHWVLYNIPAATTELESGSREFATGKNNFGKNGYNGPMPPPGHGRHHYFFWLLALDLDPDLPEGLTMQELLKKGEPHILGMNRLVGTYQRG